MKTLIVIDMQNDFISGSLANPDAQAIVDKIVKRIDEFDGMVLATRDTHNPDYLETPEGKQLPIVHCVENTEGWEIEPSIAAALQRKKAIVLDKPTFGYLGWGILSFTEDVELVGTCTDICVVSNAILIKTMYPETTVRVRADLCAGTSKDNHQAALNVMRACQMEII